VPPTVAVCERRYVVNVLMPAYGRVNPEGRCPPFQRPLIEPFAPRPAEWQIASERITVPGPKVRESGDVAAVAAKETDTGSGAVLTGVLPDGISALGYSSQ
jgi:hypothetical protein